jgi:hypothetical protein
LRFHLLLGEVADVIKVKPRDRPAAHGGNPNKREHCRDHHCYYASLHICSFRSLKDSDAWLGWNYAFIGKDCAFCVCGFFLIHP